MNSTIFVVNDDQLYIETIAEALKDAGYPDVAWQAGGSPFHQLRDAQPVLVLLDITLSNPDRGWGLLNLLKFHPKTRHIPVVLCSTDMKLLNDKVDQLRALECQALEKPFDTETLLEVVTSIIGPPPLSTS